MRIRSTGRLVGLVVSAAWLLVTLLACGQGYQRGTLEAASGEATTGEATTGQASCLEVRVSPHSDERIRELGWLGVEYEIGNACDGAVPVDLSAAVVLASPAPTARPTQGLPAPAFYDNDVGAQPIMLSAWDPQEVLRTAMLDGRRTASEIIAYVVPPGLGELNVCVELNGVGVEGAQPTCFRWIGGGS